MAKIRPFEAIRPRAELVEHVAALPYDVYDNAEARVQTQIEPLSFLAIDRPETQFEPDCDMYADRIYTKAHDLLWEQVRQGIFVRDQSKCYYIYEQSINDRSQTGIVGCAAIDDYISGVIKKHENTRQEKEQDRIRHVDACNAQTGPIFLCYRDRQEIDACVERIKKSQEPVYTFTSVDQVHNRVWKVSAEQDILFLQNAFEQIGEIYIADGHHRCSSAVKVGLKRRQEDPMPTGGKEYDFFLSVLFPDNQLMIMDYNRVVRDLNGMDTETFLQKIDGNFQISKPQANVMVPAVKGQFGLYLENKWYLLEAKKEICSEDAVEGLDVSILQKNILEPVLGINDPRTDKRIDFVGGIRGTDELERRCREDMKLAFAMHPTSIKELFRVADADRLMPPKSTWFEPKLLSGLFIHDIMN